VAFLFGHTLWTLFHYKAFAMEEKDVIDLYCKLKNLDIKIWIDGGWGVDALVGRQTRFHKDLDLAIQQKDIPVFLKLLEAQGYKEIKLDIARPHNFVLGDNNKREIDVHVIVLNDKGDGIYGPAKNGEVYPAAALIGKGKICNLEVDCISPEYVVKFHTGYDLKEKDYKDVLTVCKKYDLKIPNEYLHLKQSLTNKKLPPT
jgi:lincosamide nucleotidyltransferase A/C/D/E